MIYTVTLNPSVDYFLEVEGQMLDTEVNRASESRLVAAGKGINISKVLDSLDIDTVAYALLGGHIGTMIKDGLKGFKHIHLKAIDIKDENRINVKIDNEDRTLCVNAKGPVCPKEALDTLEGHLDSLNEHDIVVISGSMMKGIGFGDLSRICDKVKKAKAKLIVDMESLTLEDLKVLRPDLIKPNLYEFKLMTRQEDIEAGLKKLIEAGVGGVLLSMGPDGAVYFSGERSYSLKHKPVKVVNKVGCGDTMLATFIAMMSVGKDEIEALKYAGAASNARVTKMDEIKKEDILSFLDNVTVYERG